MQTNESELASRRQMLDYITTDLPRADLGMETYQTLSPSSTARDNIFIIEEKPRANRNLGPGSYDPNYALVNRHSNAFRYRSEDQLEKIKINKRNSS